MAEDRSWMYNRIEKGLVRSEFRDGVLRFVDFALHQPGCTDGAKIKCPCILPKCRNKRYLEVDEVMIHLCRKGFIPHYEVWSSHGERFVHKDTHVGESSNRVDYRGDYIQMVMDAAGPEMFDVEMDEEPNPDAKKFYELLDAATAQAHQVTYLSYPSLQRDKADWWVAIKIRARNSVSIMEIDPDTSFQEEAVNDRVDIDADEFEITLGDHMARGRGDYSQRLSSGRGSGSGGRGSVGGTGTVGSGHGGTQHESGGRHGNCSPEYQRRCPTPDSRPHLSLESRPLDTPDSGRGSVGADNFGSVEHTLANVPVNRERAWIAADGKRYSEKDHRVFFSKDPLNTKDRMDARIKQLTDEGVAYDINEVFGEVNAKTKKQLVVGLGSATSSFCIAPSGPSGESSGQSTRQVTEEIQQLKENLNIKDEEIRRLKEEQESMKEQFNEKLAEVFRRLDGTNEC
ncbi:hypothetical protein POM88_012882 [Heracleum sosnowskyi]|uniref:Transposase-associated domain-containing protein n=1 Tax=Heracleum sosnowskyi TaxID=360622 RepID=A0AAD8N2Q7_9APIA|nr:hypothetical protein POM88_012882 [Heracleum sosnowskyi]